MKATSEGHIRDTTWGHWGTLGEREREREREKRDKRQKNNPKTAGVHLTSTHNRLKMVIHQKITLNSKIIVKKNQRHEGKKKEYQKIKVWRKRNVLLSN